MTKSGGSFWTSQCVWLCIALSLCPVVDSSGFGLFNKFRFPKGIGGSQQNSGFRCPREGTFVNLRDCSVFYICRRQGYSIVAHRYQCPDGRYYNPATGFCDHPINVPQCSFGYPPGTFPVQPYPPTYPGGYPPVSYPPSINPPPVVFPPSYSPVYPPNYPPSFQPGYPPSSGYPPSFQPGYPPSFDQGSSSPRCYFPGNFTYPGNCRLYYRCIQSGQTAQVDACPFGSVFSQIARQCILGESCYPGGGLPPPGADTMCVRSGNYPVPYDCTRYYRCVLRADGGFLRELMACQPGLAFSRQRMECLPPQQVPDCPYYTRSNGIGSGFGGGGGGSSDISNNFPGQSLDSPSYDGGRVTLQGGILAGSNPTAMVQFRDFQVSNQSLNNQIANE